MYGWLAARSGAGRVKSYSVPGFPQKALLNLVENIECKLSDRFAGQVYRELKPTTQSPTDELMLAFPDAPAGSSPDDPSQ